MQLLSSNLLLLSLSLALLLLGNQVYAFQSSPTLSAGHKKNNLPTTSSSSRIHRCNTRLHSISNSGGNDSSSEGEEELEQEQEDDSGAATSNNNIFAALPPIGTSSFWDRQDDDDTEKTNNINLSSNNIVVSRKFHLSYTCKLCDTRNSHSITRLGYNHGVVIAVCNCCHSKHLIADNLGWSNYLVSGFDYDGGERNIEDHVRNKLQNTSGSGESDDEDGNGGDVSLRVDRGVFDLESLWHEEKDVNNEAVLIDEDGEDWN